MSIHVIYDRGDRFSQHQAQIARRRVHESMFRTGRSGLSATGWTLGFAVEWCEIRGLPYVIEAHPGEGYLLTLANLVTVLPESEDADFDSTVYVVACNDYPDALFYTEEEAKNYCDRKRAEFKDNSCEAKRYYHMHALPLR